MIPYFELPSLTIPLPFSLGGVDHITFYPFGLLVALAVLFGHWHSMRYAERKGLSTDTLGAMIGPMLITGFIASHVFEVLVYEPENFFEKWWKVWDGISSYGGFFGAFLALWVYSRIYRIPLRPYADAIAYGLTHAWIIGRAACATAHDHPGRLSNSFLTLRFPDDHRYAGQRFDLGVMEMLYAGVMIVILRLFIAPRVQRPGELTVWVCLLYAPVRFLMDFLRLPEADARYWGLTPAHYASILTVVLCGIALVRIRMKPPESAKP